MKLRKDHRLRVVLLGGLFIGLCTAVTGRLYELQHLKSDHYKERATRQHFKRVVIQPERGAILDRNGRTLAQSTGRLTLYVNPKNMVVDPVSKRARSGDTTLDLQQIARVVANESGEPLEDIQRKLESKRPTALVRRMRPETARKLMTILDSYDIDGRGYWLHRESVRLYPSHVAAPVIGFCSRTDDGDNAGLAGIELAYNQKLEGRRIEATAPRSAISETLEPWNPEDLHAARGSTLVLTIDANVQQAVEKVLEETVTKWNAASGGAVVMDTNTGAVIAMGQYPTFDNNEFATAPGDHIRNRCLTDPLETGSVVKLYTAAMLLDRGYLTPETLIDCEGGYAVVDGRRLQDSPGHRLYIASFRETLRWSSNVGIVKAAQTLTNPEWYKYLTELNFGSPTGIDLPGEGGGILHPLERWTKFSRTSLPMGYEIALTPVQITAAVSTLVNGGYYYKPHVVAEVRDSRGNVVEQADTAPVRQVFRPTTSAIMRDLMEDVVDSGTGKKAVIPGYRIGGKTGTTRKSDVFDHREYIASFAGVVPIHAPQLTIYVYIDDPKGEYYASAVAAPAFQEIAKAATLHLGIAPSEEIVVDEKSRKQSKMPEEEQITISASSNLTLSAREYVSLGKMPDFQGMTVKQAREALPKKASRVKFLGSGFVTDQFPPVGEPLSENLELVLHFSPERPAPPAVTQPANSKATKGAPR